MDFPITDYRNMLISRHRVAQLGMTAMEPWPVHRAARLMAIVQVWGNNEGFTLSPKFNADREYIQELYGIRGGYVPDEDFKADLRVWVERFESVKSDTAMDFIDARDWIKKMYGFKLLC